MSAPRPCAQVEAAQNHLSEDGQYAAALAALDIGPERLRRLLTGFGPAEAWDAIARGRHPADPDRRCRRLARPEVVDRIADACDASASRSG
jgi:hypothetical protein